VKRAECLVVDTCLFRLNIAVHYIQDRDTRFDVLREGQKGVGLFFDHEFDIIDVGRYIL